MNNMSKIDKYELNHVAAKLFFSICKEWSLTDEQACILIGFQRSTHLNKLKKQLNLREEICLSKEMLERLSLLAGIYKNLQLLFEDHVQWKEWIHKRNREFGGGSALDRMLAGDSKSVRRYLDCSLQENYT